MDAWIEQSFIVLINVDDDEQLTWRLGDYIVWPYDFTVWLFVYIYICMHTLLFTDKYYADFSMKLLEDIVWKYRYVEGSSNINRGMCCLKKRVSPSI